MFDYILSTYCVICVASYTDWRIIERFACIVRPI